MNYYHYHKEDRSHRALEVKPMIYTSEFEGEIYITVEGVSGVGFVDCMEYVFMCYLNMLKALDLNMDTEIYIKFFLSDISNQAQELSSTIHKWGIGQSAFLSVLGLAPANGSKLSIVAYHIRESNKFNKTKLPSCLIVEHNNCQTIFSKHAESSKINSYDQTNDIFNNLDGMILKRQGQMSQNCIRTWIYVRDIDNNYSGMVKARREFFEQRGLTPETHFIASTGIEGTDENPHQLVAMEALSIYNLPMNRITFLKAPQMLNPTHEYGVTFERGTKVNFGDRSHYYISGTASIDSKGQIMHKGDVSKQTHRTIKNIKALLNNGGATFDQMHMLIVYIRDQADYPMIKELLKKLLPTSAPYLILSGAICRPAWLIEIEGIAIKKTFKDNTIH